MLVLQNLFENKYIDEEKYKNLIKNVNSTYTENKKQFKSEIIKPKFL